VASAATPSHPPPRELQARQRHGTGPSATLAPGEFNAIIGFARKSRVASQNEYRGVTVMAVPDKDRIHVTDIMSGEMTADHIIEAMRRRDVPSLLRWLPFVGPTAGRVNPLLAELEQEGHVCSRWTDETPGRRQLYWKTGSLR
jgi:hypothetical protein